MPQQETDPVAEQLADVLPDLSHPSGQRVWLTGLAGEKMRRTRATVAEAIVAWLRKQSEEKQHCILCGVADGEVQRANDSAREAWEHADRYRNRLRAFENVASQ